MKHIRPYSFGPHTPLPSRLPHVEARACRDLWVAVLLSVLRDLCASQPQSAARGTAEAWVGHYPRRDFRTVCHLAGIGPDWLHGALSDLVAMPVADRRHRLAALLGCQPGQIGFRLMLRQTAPENPRESTGDTEQDRARTPAPVPVSTGARRARIATMFARGVTPSDMPQAFATEGHAVSMSQVWNDIRHLRAAGRIGYLRDPRAAPPVATSGGYP